jgi:hypothetical protein
MIFSIICVLCQNKATVSLKIAHGKIGQKNTPFHVILQYLKGQCHGIFNFRFFFMNQFSPSPWLSHLGRFEFFPKFAEKICSSRCTKTVFIILFGLLWVVELTYRKIFPSSSLKGVFTPVSLIPVVHLDLWISRIRNDPNVIFRSLGEDYSWKKTWSKKSRDTVPLSTFFILMCSSH